MTGNGGDNGQRWGAVGAARPGMGLGRSVRANWTLLTILAFWLLASGAVWDGPSIGAPLHRPHVSVASDDRPADPADGSDVSARETIRGWLTNTSAFQREFQNQYLDVRNNLGRLRCMGKPSEPLNVVVLRLETRLDGLAPISQSLAIEIHNEIRRAVTGATSRGTGTTISGDNVRVDASPTLPWNAWKRPDFEDNLFNAVHSSSITDDVVLHSTAHLNDAEQLILTARFLGRDAAGSYRNCNDTIILEVPLELLAGDFNASLEETYRGIIEFIYALPASSSQLFREFAAKFPQGDVGLIILLLVGSGLLYIIAIAFRAARRAISLEVGVKPRMATVETLNNTVIRRDPPSLSWGDEP